MTATEPPLNFNRRRDIPKWQPGRTNQFAPFNSGRTYLVPPDS